MSVQVVHCPSCGAPLHPTRFARTTACEFCGATVLVDPDAVPRARFRRAFAAWSDPGANGWDPDRCVTVAERSWQVAGWLAQGDHAEVFAATLARHPTERVVLKVADAGAALERQARALTALAASTAPGADTFARRVPAVVARGVVATGPAAGRAALLLGWPSGFVHTFEDVAREYPAGVPPEASVWLWRRVLEALSFVHRSGWAHGALLPRHLLVHAREHGVLPVGWSRAAPLGGGPPTLTPAAPSADDAPFIPGQPLDAATLDLAMLARALVHVLGGAPGRGTLPASVPAPLAELVLAVAEGRTEGRDAWALREHVGQVARGVFGPPRFIPFAMPGW